MRKFNIKYLNYEVFMLSYNLGGASNEWNEEADEWERESELVQMQFSIWIAEEISYQTSRIVHTALRGKVDVINRKIIWKSFVRYFSTLKLSSPLDVNLILKRKWYKRVFRYPTCSAICKCANVVYPVLIMHNLNIRRAREFCAFTPKARLECEKQLQLIW